MLETIFEIISQKPEFFTWVFGVVNALWISFLYFNTKRHKAELECLKQSLNLDLERRKKVFEMKSSQYEAYFKSIDALHNRHQTDYQDVVLPIINDFNSAYTRAMSAGNTNAATEASILFQERIGKISRDGFQEVQVIKSETNTLRLTASDAIAELLDELEVLYDKMFEHSGKMISDLVKITMNNDQKLASENQAILNKLGDVTKAKSRALREQMRLDLQNI